MNFLLRKYNSLFLKKKCLNRNFSGYIVLVPEIGEDYNDINSASKPNDLPSLSQISIEHCIAAIAKLSADMEKVISKIEETSCKKSEIDLFNDVFNPIEEASVPLDTMWGIAKTLYLGSSSLMPTKVYMDIHDRAKRARCGKFTSQIIHKLILEETEKKPIQNKQKKRLIDKYLLEGKLNGLGISLDKQQLLKSLLFELNQENSRFKAKVDTAIKYFNHKITDYSKVRDFPPNFLENLSTDPSQPTKGPWTVKLWPKIVKEFLEHCPDKTERWNVWQADVRKASSHIEKSLDNSVIIENIRSLRQRQANLLGYQNFMEMSLETKALKSVNSIKDVISELLQHAFPAQKREIENLNLFAKNSGCPYQLEACDIPYWRRKQLKGEHNFDEEVLRDYFPLPSVMSGLFRLLENLFGIKIVEKSDVEVWHPNVKYFDIYQSNNPKTPTSGFFLDCYTREKELHRFSENCGWMIGMRNRSKLLNTSPLSAIMFNFPPPIYGKPYLLSIRDIQTVFKTFGTAIQHLLTKAEYSDLAGLSNVEWDATQVCGNVIAYFLHNPKIIESISCHYNTEEPVSSNDIKSIKTYLTHMAGYDLCKELYISHLDVELYTKKNFWLDIVKDCWPKYNILPLDKKDSHVCSLTDIFCGNWAAAYYSRFYSKLIAADIYSAVLEENSSQEDFSNSTIGKRFNETFVASGGSISFAEIFRNFRGRDPSATALLKFSELYT